MFSQLRQQALNTTAKELGLAATPELQHVWGVLMETGYPNAVASLVVIADGTTSLYFSSGGCFLATITELYRGGL